MDGQVVEKEETDCNIGLFLRSVHPAFFNQSCSVISVICNFECNPWKAYFVPTYFSDVWLDGANITKNMSPIASYPEVPLSRCKFARKGRRKGEPPRHRFSSLLSPSHGHTPFVTSHSRFALASVRKTKRLRRRQCLRHDSGNCPPTPSL